MANEGPNKRETTWEEDIERMRRVKVTVEGLLKKLAPHIDENTKLGLQGILTLATPWFAVREPNKFTKRNIKTSLELDERLIARIKSDYKKELAPKLVLVKTTS